MDAGSGLQTNKDKILRITSGELTKQSICVRETDNSICNCMFQGCTKLTSLDNFNLPQDITIVGAMFCFQMFQNCTSLISIGDFQIPKDITAVGNDFCYHTFGYCTSLISIGEFNLPQGITDAAQGFCDSTFSSCKSLVSIGDFQLSQGITTVGNSFFKNAFENCNKLETIPTSFFGDLQLSQTELDKNGVFSNAFYNCSIATGDMTGVPMLQISPTARNQCFSYVPNVSNVPTNWK